MPLGVLLSGKGSRKNIAALWPRYSPVDDEDYRRAASGHDDQSGKPGGSFGNGEAQCGK